MLVISRKSGESILIGDDIEITVIESQNGKVKLGVNAKKSIRVLRKEIVDEVTAENIHASSKNDDQSIEKIGIFLNKEIEK
ncbi:MAG: carbon storage regulator CsrA [Clostridia bacterium]|jgi:carbon storage regulator